VRIEAATRKLVIGQARYPIKETGKNVEIIGDTRYLDGERDWEHVLLRHDTLIAEGQDASCGVITISLSVFATTASSS